MDKEDETRYKFIYEILCNQYSLEWNRTRDIQNKATNIVSSIGLILSIILAIFSTILKEIPENHLLPILFSLALCLTLMLISVFLGIHVLNVRKWRYLSHEIFFQKYAKDEKIEFSELINILSERVVKYITENQELNTTNAKYLRISYYIFNSALILAVMLFFFSLNYISKN